MKDFFYPENVAVIGISDSPDNLGKLILKNLDAFAFKGRWHAVGRIPGKVFGQPIYRSVGDVPEKIDLAAILTRAEHVPDVVEECGRKGIRRLTISTAGFSEYHPGKIALENRILATCKDYDIRFIGPNCLAVVNMANGLCLPFNVQDPKYWVKGPVGIISQSGTVAIHYAKHLCYGKIGVGKVASIGNKLNVDEVDLLEYFLEDPETELVFLYLESFSRPREFLELAASSSKPIVLHKSNISALSQGVAKSHTNAVTGNDRITAFALEQAGIIRVQDIYETMNCVKAALLPPMKGNRLVVMSPGGGTAVMGADEAHRHDFILPDLPEDVLDWLKSKGRARVINLTNPLDLGDIYDTSAYCEIIAHLLNRADIDGIFMDLGYAPEWDTIVPYDKFFEFFNTSFTTFKKPLFLRANVAHPAGLQNINAAVTVPYFESMPGAFRAIRKVMAARAIVPRKPVVACRLQRHPAIEKILHDALSGNKPFLDHEGFEILKVMGLSVPEYRYMAGNDTKAMDGLGLKFPVALKAMGGKAIHKTDMGGVMIGLQNATALKTAMHTMASACGLTAPDRFMIQEMVPKGIEIFVGAKRDPQFGPVIVVGAGGVLVELLNDVCAAPAPVDSEMANRMLKNLKSYSLLTGYRGSPPADAESLIAILVKISNLIAAYPEIEEIDLNPVMVMGKRGGAVAVDCKIFLNTLRINGGSEKREMNNTPSTSGQELRNKSGKELSSWK